MSHHTMTIPWRAPNAMSDSIAWSSGTFMLIASALTGPRAVADADSPQPLVARLGSVRERQQ